MEATFAAKAAAVSTLIDRASEDAGERERLRRDATAAVKDALGGQLPDSVEVRVVEDEQDVRHVVLPFAARPAAEEIADLQRLPESTPATRDFYARVFQDPEFRRRVAKDPRAALAEVLARHGQSLAEGVSLRVLEETESIRYLVLPPAARAETDDALSDADLELVAGGVTGGSITKTYTLISPTTTLYREPLSLSPEQIASFGC